jgi:hypothetical protein
MSTSRPTRDVPNLSRKERCGEYGVVPGGDVEALLEPPLGGAAGVLAGEHVPARPMPEAVEDGAVAAKARFALDPRLRAHVLLGQLASQIGEVIGSDSRPIDAPIRVEWVLRDQPAVSQIRIETPAHPALDRGHIVQRRMVRAHEIVDWRCQEIGDVGVAVLRVRGDKARCWKMSIVCRAVRVAPIDVEWQPDEHL